MKTIIEVNKGLLSDEHLVLTDKGLVKAKELKVEDKIIDIYGNVVEIVEINVCGEPPDAPIVGETGTKEV